MNTAAAPAKYTPVSSVPHCILGGFSLPLTVEEYRIVAEFPDVFSVDKPGRIALPVTDAQALGWTRFR